jgi:hypothetical protein
MMQYLSVKKLSVLILICFISSCNNVDDKNSYNQNYKIISVNVVEVEGFGVKSNEFISDFHLVELSTPENVYFGNPDVLQIKNNSIYIMDLYQTNKLLKFDLEGQFKYEIMNYGQGPGEFISPRDFALDYENDRLAILDQGNLKVSLFDNHSGNFIEDVHLDFRPDKFYKSEGGYVFFTNNLEFIGARKNVIFTDNNFSIEKSYLEIPEEKRNVHFGLSRNFTQYNDNLLLTMPFKDVIFSVKEDYLEPYLKIDFGDFHLPDDFFRVYQDNNIRREKREEYAYNVDNYLESENYIFFSYRHSERLHYYFFSKQTNRVIHVKRRLIDFTDTIGTIMGSPLGIVDDYLIWFQQPHNLRSYIDQAQQDLPYDKWIEFKENNKDLIGLNESLESGSNAYLIFSKLDF